MIGAAGFWLKHWAGETEEKRQERVETAFFRKYRRRIAHELRRQRRLERKLRQVGLLQAAS